MSLTCIQNGLLSLCWVDNAPFVRAVIGSFHHSSHCQAHNNSHAEWVQNVCAVLTLVLTLPCHIFEAVWQQKQFSDVVDAPPASTAVIVMDFAKNFKCEMQREVQSAHWYAQQITLHPCIAFYPCDTCNL